MGEAREGAGAPAWAGGSEGEPGPGAGPDIGAKAGAKADFGARASAAAQQASDQGWQGSDQDTRCGDGISAAV